MSLRPRYKMHLAEPFAPGKPVCFTLGTTFDTTPRRKLVTCENCLKIMRAEDLARRTRP